MSRKQENPTPESLGLVKSNIPPIPKYKFNNKRVAEIFNEWTRRYADNQEGFSKCLDENGKPHADYGDVCAEYFQKINEELP